MRELSNTGGPGLGIWVELRGDNATDGLITATSVDLRSEGFTEMAYLGKRPAYRFEKVGTPFELTDTGYVATASDLPIMAGFVHEWDYAMRRGLSPSESKQAFEAFKSCHVSLVISGKSAEGSGEVSLLVFAGDRDNLAYEETLLMA
jgi:hypothetical protein